LTQARAHTPQVDLRRALRAHRSSAPLQALGDLVSTGPTGTNVNDVIVMVLGGESSP
jgi:hydroxypyruvate reductase